jgi:hypothetical protein
MRKSRLAVISLALAVLTSLTMVRLSVAAQKRPEDVNSTITIPAGEVCPFGVQLSQSGKTKTIKLPGDSLHHHVTGPLRHTHKSRGSCKTGDAEYYRRVSQNDRAER